MKAAVLYGREDVRIEEVVERPLKEGEVRVRIKAALTCGTDLKVYKRGYHARMIVPPAVFGHEFSGVISEAHPRTEGWQTGERVVAANSAPCGNCWFCGHNQENLCDDLLFLNGAYAESIAVPARLVEKNLLRLKASTAFEDAALAEPLACVAQGFEDLRMEGSERLLVIGSGPIGLMFVKLGRHLGCKVSLAGRGEKRLQTAIRLGAEEVIDTTGKETITAVRDQLKEEADVVVEAVGQPEVWEAAAQLVRKGGKVNFFGGCPSGSKVSLDTGLIHYSSLSLLASFHHTPRAIRRALELIESGVIQAADFVDQNCRLEELPGLFRSMTEGNRVIKTLVGT